MVQLVDYRDQLILSPKFGDIMILVWTPQPHLPQPHLPRPPPPHAKACVSRNCDINARIKFIFDTAIDDLEWNNPIHFGHYRENQKACALHNLIKNAPINFIFDVATDLL